MYLPALRPSHSPPITLRRRDGQWRPTVTVTPVHHDLSDPSVVVACSCYLLSRAAAAASSGSRSTSSLARPSESTRPLRHLPQVTRRPHDRHGDRDRTSAPAWSRNRRSKSRSTMSWLGPSLVPTSSTLSSTDDRRKTRRRHGQTRQESIRVAIPLATDFHLILSQTRSQWYTGSVPLKCSLTRPGPKPSKSCSNESCSRGCMPVPGPRQRRHVRSDRHQLSMQ
jgi:hypothetical protein